MPDDPREPREDLDRWLQARIDPLPPPPGTFDLIKRRVRRRRYRQVAVSAAVAAAVAGAVVVVPRVATSVLHVNQNPTAQGAASGGNAQGRAPSKSGGGGSGVAGNGTEAPQPTATNPAPALVPGNFQVSSVTFIGPNTGWVIGQAGTPGNCSTQYCTSMARTTDSGATWAGAPAPLAGAPDGASGVGQVRFLNASDGWAFGPQLFATTDGGKTWTEESTNGRRVIALETVGTRAFAIFATCTGAGTDYAAQCTSFSLYSTPAGQDSWTSVSGAANLANGGQDGSASLVLTSGQGYLLAPDGSLYSGPVDGTGSWQQVTSTQSVAATCTPGAAQADGQPSGALFTTASNAGLVLVCVNGGEAQVFTSSDGGSAWQQGGTVSGGTATSADTQEGGEIILATTTGIQVSRDDGKTWQVAAQGGFSWVGMTSPTQGVAVPENTSQHGLWFTYTSGQSWQESKVSGP